MDRPDLDDEEYDRRPWPHAVQETNEEIRARLSKMADKIYAQTIHARKHTNRASVFVPLDRDTEDEHLERLMNGDEPLNNKDRAK